MRAQFVWLSCCVTLSLAAAYSSSPPLQRSAAWSSSEAFIGFKLDHYENMLNDVERTSAFEQAIQRRLHGQRDMVVLDLGTGPFAILALFAARAGARRVFAIEANAAAAEQAREAVAEAVARGDVLSGVIEVIEGFSTDVTLPEKVDLLVAEICGSVASEEGLCHTMRDARLRHLRTPDDPASYIPMRCQTVAVPASYSLNHRCATDEAAMIGNSWHMHQAGGSAPPDAPAGEYSCIRDVHAYTGVGPVRFNCDDPWMLPLSAPLVWEDYAFHEAAPPGPGIHSPVSPLEFRITAATIEANGRRFAAQLEQHGVGAEEAARAAEGVAGSLCGVALWLRLVLDEGGAAEPPIVVESRGSAGEPKVSHWQTLLPLFGAPTPLKAGDVITVRPSVELEEDIQSPPWYELDASVAKAGAA